MDSYITSLKNGIKILNSILDCSQDRTDTEILIMAIKVIEKELSSITLQKKISEFRRSEFKDLTPHQFSKMSSEDWNRLWDVDPGKFQDMAQKLHDEEGDDQWN